MSGVKVSVIVITYNHEKYISECIESIIRQDVNFKIEIIVGDDCSNDGTRSIISEYAEKYSILIPVFNTNNKGTTKNVYDLLNMAKGDYIAFCEGDDFWTDMGRLKHDVDFLEEHKECSAVASKCRIVDQDGNTVDEKKISQRSAFWQFDKPEFSKEDFEAWQMPGHVSATTWRNFFRNSGDKYDILYRASNLVGDRTLVMFFLMNGKISCIDHEISAYRYITTGSAENYEAVSRTKNYKDKDYKMMISLEEWAEQNNYSIDLDAVKKDRFCGAVVLMMKEKNAHNKEVVRNIIKYSGQPIKYMFYLLKIYIVKNYWWKVRKMDQLITL